MRADAYLSALKPLRKSIVLLVKDTESNMPVYKTGKKNAICLSVKK